MNTHETIIQIFLRIQQSGLARIADDLVGLLRYAIRLQTRVGADNAELE